MKFSPTACLFVALFLALAKKPAAIDATNLKHPVKPVLWKIEGKDLTSDVKKIGGMIKEHVENSMSKNEELGRRLMKTLLDDRNITMTVTIAKKLSEHPGSSQFFAVGAAHYTGQSAIQDLLTKKGYTITPAFK